MLAAVEKTDLQPCKATTSDRSGDDSRDLDGGVVYSLEKTQKVEAIPLALYIPADYAHTVKVESSTGRAYGADLRAFTTWFGPGGARCGPRRKWSSHSSVITASGVVSAVSSTVMRAERARWAASRTRRR